MTENKRFVYYEHKGADYILDNPNLELDFIEMLGDCLEAEEIVDLLNEQEEKNMQLRNQIKIFELFLDCNDLDIEWDLFCTKEDGCPFTDASCQECIYLGISNGDVE